MGIFKKSKPMTTSTQAEVVPGAVKEEKSKSVSKVEVEESVRPPSPDDVVVDGKLFEKVSFTENGCSKSKLVEVK